MMDYSNVELLVYSSEMVVFIRLWKGVAFLYLPKQYFHEHPIHDSHMAL